MSIPRVAPSGPPLTINGQPANFGTGALLRQSQKYTSFALAGTVNYTANTGHILPDNDGTSPLLATLDAPNPELYYQAEAVFIWSVDTINVSIDPIQLEYSTDGGATWHQENTSAIAGLAWPWEGAQTLQLSVKSAPRLGSALGVGGSTASLMFHLAMNIGSDWKVFAQRHISLQELAP